MLRKNKIFIFLNFIINLTAVIYSMENQLERYKISFDFPNNVKIKIEFSFNLNSKYELNIIDSFICYETETKTQKINNYFDTTAFLSSEKAVKAVGLNLENNAEIEYQYFFEFLSNNLNYYKNLDFIKYYNYPLGAGFFSFKNLFNLDELNKQYLNFNSLKLKKYFLSYFYKTCIIRDKFPLKTLLHSNEYIKKDFIFK